MPSSAHSNSIGEETTPSPELLQFTFLLISAGDFPFFKDTHHVIEKSEGFSQLSLSWREFPPIKIVLREAVFVLIRNRDATCKT